MSLAGMVETPSPPGEEKIIPVAMRRYRLGSHTKTDIKVHLVWIPKYRKKILSGEVAVRTRDILRQIALEHELEIISGKVASDHVHLFITYRPTQNISKIVQWLKGISSRILLSEFAHHRKHFWVTTFGLAVILPSALVILLTR